MQPRMTLDAAMPRIVETVARTLRAEAGDAAVRGIEALAALLLARVCRAPFQFACWQPRHPRQAALRAPEDASLAICRRIAARAAAGSLPDATGGATHWHRAAELPGWALGQVPVAEIGGLVFYRLDA